MSYNPSYPQRINFENDPSTATPLNQTNLNKMDNAIYQHDMALSAQDERITDLEGEDKVTSFKGRTGVVTPADDDYTIAQIKATGSEGQIPALNAQGKLAMVTPNKAGHDIVDKVGNVMTTRDNLQFVGAVSVTDDATNNKTIVNVTGGGGGGGAGHEIENSAGTKLTQRDVMQVLDGLEAVDDSTNQKTKIKMNLPIVSSADWNAMTEQEKTAYKASHYRFGVEVPDTEGVINAEYMKLLWENPNTTQAFAAQTVTLSSADWDFLLVVAGTASIILKKGVTTLNAMSVPFAYSSRMIIDTRQLHLDANNNVVFESAYRIQQTSAGSAITIAQNDSFIIPVAIYGIKASFQFKVNAIATDLSTRADHCFLSDNETSVEDYITTVSRETIRTGVVLERYGKYRRLAMRNISPTSSNGLIATLSEEDRPHQFSTNIVLGVAQGNTLYPCYTNVNATTGDIQAYYFTPGTTTDSPAPTTMKIYGDIDWLVD